MEKRTTQRIIGILVVAALIVILIPILFSGNTTQAPVQTADTKASSVAPEATMATSDATTIASTDSATSTPNPVQPVTDAQPQPIAQPPAPAVTPAPVIVALPQPVATTKPTVATATTTSPTEKNADVTITQSMSHTINAYNEQKAEATAPIKTTSGIQVATTSQPKSQTTTTTITVPAEGVPAAEPTKENLVATAVEQPKKPKHVKPLKLIHKASGPKGPAWVVQMGSFKVKSNATRLLAELKAEGYKAFSREGRSSTLVYVGPESQHASAESLATDIQQKMDMQGIVVSYQRIIS